MNIYNELAKIKLKYFYISIPIFSPTVHQGFASNEEYQREKYEVAQQIGENGFDCDSIYSECENSFLTQISFLSNRIQSM